ncbi:MAG: hypothetical protein R2834_09550 [Rhodothermales bacterium]
MNNLPNTLRIVSSLALVAAIPFLSGCDSEEPDPSAGETEFITQVRLTLTPMSGGSAVVVQADDPDGDGANLTIDAIQLTAGETYTGTIVLYDGVNDEDITAEVQAEAEEHQFWYQAEGGIADRITVTITDQDANNLPIGLAFTLAVSDGGAATGTFNVALSHYDASPKDGTGRSDETDVDIDFPVSIVP